LVAVAAELACVPGGTMTGVLSTPAQIKAAYRLFDAPAVTHAAVGQGHFAHVRSQCQAPGQYLLIEDTTAVAYGDHEACVGLGPIGEDPTRGFWLHSTLAVAWRPHPADPQAGAAQILGLFDQQAWTRDPQASRRQETKAQRLQRIERESTRWGRVLTGALAPAPQAQWIFVADREADIYETFTRCGGAPANFVVRVAQNRALAPEAPDAVTARCLEEALAAAPVRARTSLELSAQEGRTARTAQMALRTARVVIRAPWRPGGAGPDVGLHLVELKEIDPPAGEKPVRWLLATDLPVTSLADAWRVVTIYRHRWLIEEFHKALKTGVGVENSQLASARKLMALAGILSIVAAWLVGLKLQARVAEPWPLRPADADPVLLTVLTHKVGVPAEGWTARSLLVAIARLGGYLNRKSDGPPGWLTIWRGWQRLVPLTEGYRLAMRQRCGER
jgi:hypothetical protein